MSKFKKWLIPVVIVCLLAAVLVSGNAGLSLGEIFDPSGNPLAHRFSDEKDIRTATFVVAAADSEHRYDVDFRCSGVNDQVEIQAAIDASNGKVVLLDGNYAITAVITIPHGVTLEGQSAESTVLTQTSTGINLIDITDATKIPKVVRNLTLTGDADSGHGIFFNAASYCSIENCKINAHAGYGFYFDNASHYSQIVNCYIQENLTGGVYMEDANFNTFLNCKFDLNPNYAVNIQRGAAGTLDISFKHCSFEAQPQMAINLNGVHNILFETCWWENNTTASGTEEILITDCSVVTFRDCMITMAAAANAIRFIKLDNSDYVTLENNRCMFNGKRILYIEANCGRNFFLDNYIDNLQLTDNSYRLVVRGTRMHTATRWFSYPASESMGYFKATIDNLDLQNLTNHSSEEDAEHWTGGGITPPTIAWEKNDGWYDKYSAKITFAAGCGGGMANSQAGRVIAGVTTGRYYVLTCMLKASVSTVALELQVTGASAQGYHSIYEPPTEWTKFVIVCKAAIGTGTNYLYVTPMLDPGVQVDVWIDDIQIFEFTDREDQTRVADFAATNYLPVIELMASRKPAQVESEGIYNFAFEERSAIADILEILGDVRGLWPFKSPYGTVVEDFSRRGHDMTPSEGCQLWDTPPRFRGKATIFTFNGVDEGMALASHLDFQFGNAAGDNDSAFSVICIIRPAANTYPYTLIGKYNEDTPAREWIFRLDANKYPEFEIYDESATEYQGREHQVAITEDVITILIATYAGDEASAGVKIYKNGIQVDNANHQSVGAYVGMERLGADVKAGYNVVGGPADGNFLNGGASWFGITGKELSADECWSITQRLWGLLGM